MRRFMLCLGLLLVAGCSGRGQLKPITPTASPAAPGTLTASPLSTSPQAPSRLSASQIVLSLDELNALAGEALYREGQGLADLSAPLPAGGKVDPPSCSPALRGLQNRSVAGDGVVSFRAVEAVTVGDPALPEERRRKDDFVQVVAVYPDERAAKAVYAALSAGVRACGGRSAVDSEPGGGAKTRYTVGVETASPDTLRWSQHQADWGPNQRCLLEARGVGNAVLQGVECGLDEEKAPMGQLLAQVLDKAAGRVS